MQFNGFVFIESSASSRCQKYHCWRQPNESKRMTVVFFSQVPLCLKTERQSLSFQRAPLSTVTGILTSVSATLRYFPKHKLSSCDVSGVVLPDGMIQSMCCLRVMIVLQRGGFQWLGFPQSPLMAPGICSLATGPRNLSTLSAIYNGYESLQFGSSP